MTRWHKPDCTAPSVAVDAHTGRPSCLSCDTTPDLDELIRLQAHESPFPAPPPDEPRGQMNLWWPRSVPYFTPDKTPSSPLDSHAAQPQRPQSSATTPCPARPEQNTNIPSHKQKEKQNPIYPNRLPPSSIRLARLPATASPKSAPIHLSLETCRLSNCPPYETASYCWAGEDDNTSLTGGDARGDAGGGGSRREYPVYVGVYWDVVLHTRSCADLLRFLRPASARGSGGGGGERLVWVDAVCINQDNDVERAEQVALMGRIYTGAWQVVVYLGPDVAPVLEAGRFPGRGRLNGLVRVDGGGGKRGVKRLKELVKRRYFSRLWVVQELILSPRVVVRIGDVDYLSDGRTSGNLWVDSELAPWVLHAARGAPLDGLSLLEVMWLTCSTNCADPRDRLFGIMGVVPEGRWRLEPDYSLSVQHVFIGLFAHFVIAKGMTELLSFTSGASGPASIPSWVPDWTSWEAWRPTLKVRGTPGISLVLEGTVSLVTENWPPGGKTELAAVFLPRRYLQTGSAGEQTFSVDSMTAALSARMVRMLVLRAVPKVVGRLDVLNVSDGLTIFELTSQHGTVYLTSRARLDLLVKPDSDYLYLFLLEKESRMPGLCILRETRGGTRLVATCEAALFQISWPEESPNPNGNWLGLWDRLPAELPWTDAIVDDLGGSLFVGDLYWTLSETMQRAQAWLDARLDPGEQLLFLPKHDSTRRDVLSVYRSFFDNEKNFATALDGYKHYAVQHCGARCQPPDSWER